MMDDLALAGSNLIKLDAKVARLEDEIERLREALDKCRLVAGTRDAVTAIVNEALKQD